MEITLENKAKFLASHIGCRFYANDCLTILDDVRSSSEYPFGWIDTLGQKIYTCKGSAILKPISSITDDDYIVLMFKKYPYQPYSMFERKSICPEHFNQEQIDALRGRGYALPFHDLSVDDMIEAGWVKLRTS